MQTNSFEFGGFAIEFKTFFGTVFNGANAKTNGFRIFQGISLIELKFGSVQNRRFSTPKFRLWYRNILFNFVGKTRRSSIFGNNFSFSITNNGFDCQVNALNLRADIYFRHIARHKRCSNIMRPLLKTFFVFHQHFYLTI